jgi:hypothetical protein
MVGNLGQVADHLSPKGTVNPVYRRYAQAAGFHVDACPVRHPEAKGKVESRIGHLVSALLSAHPNGFASVAEAWEAERALLRPADALPDIFDTEQAHCRAWALGRRF